MDGECVALVTSPGFTRRGLVDHVKKLMNHRVALVLDNVAPNPNLESVDALRRVQELDAIDSVIALGGGSSIDTAKALSRILSSNVDEPLSKSFWEGTGIETREIVPVFAIPTTAGTGSEVTSTATIWDYECRVKHSLCGDDLYPKAAVVDPVLTYDLPASVTVSSGLDAVSHALESIWNRNANPMSLMLARESLKLSIDALPKLKSNEHDYHARESMAQASLMAGLAISQTRTALSHSMSYPITMDFGIPHGIACSFALPEVLEFNAVSDDGRLDALASDLRCGTVSDLRSNLSNLLKTLLSDTNLLDRITGDSLTLDLVGRMFTKGRTDNNLRPVELDDLRGILEKALLRYKN